MGVVVPWCDPVTQWLYLENQRCGVNIPRMSTSIRPPSTIPNLSNFYINFSVWSSPFTLRATFGTLSSMDFVPLRQSRRYWIQPLVNFHWNLYFINFRLRRDSSMKLFFLIPLMFIVNALAGPAAYGVCQGGCATIVMACYSAAGFTWGATVGASAPGTIIACNLAFGKCQAECAATLLAPTP